MQKLDAVTRLMPLAEPSLANNTRVQRGEASARRQVTHAGR